MIKGFNYNDEIGVELGLKYDPIERVGFYSVVRLYIPHQY